MPRWRVEPHGREEATVWVVVKANEAGGDTFGGESVYKTREDAVAEAARLNRLDEEPEASSE